MEIRDRIKEWRAVFSPSWKWAVVIPFAALGGYQTIQQQWLTDLPLRFSLPLWFWFLFVAVVVVLVLEGTYRRIRSIRKESKSESTELQNPAHYAPEPYHHLVVVAGQSGVIGNVEENEENVSITGTVSNRQAAVVLKKGGYGLT